MSEEAPQKQSDSNEREFPIFWTPDLDGVAEERDFNLTLQWLGSLMVAYNHLEHRIRTMVSYLINEDDFRRADAALAYLRQSGNLLDLFEELFALKVTDPSARDELKKIKVEIKKHVEKRNLFAHSRLVMPGKMQEAAAMRVKSDDLSNILSGDAR
jgi:hypothetical protein